MSASVGVYVATAIFLAVSTAQAQPPMPSHFSSAVKSGTFDLYLKRGRSVVDVSTGTCQGYVSGPVKMVGRIGVLKAEPGGTGVCTLRITFSKNYMRASIKENNCTHWHGVSCQFEGPVLRRRK